MRHPIPERYRRPAGLLCVLLLHVMVIWFWRPVSAPAPPGVRHEIEVFMVPPVRIEASPLPVEPILRPAQRQAQPPAARRPEAPAVTLIVPPAAQQPPAEAAPAPVAEADAFEPVEPSAPAPTLQERSRRLAIGIDKQLRKESLNDKDRAPPQEPALARDIGAAFRDRTFQMSDTKMGNGDTMTRVRTRFGTYCVRTNGNRPTAGRDPFKDSGKQTMVSCPN